MLATSPIPTAALEGRAIGVLVMAGFGALWILMAAKFLKRLDCRAWLMVALITGIVCVGAGKQLRFASHMSGTLHSGSETGSSRLMGRQFGIALALEWIAILGVVVVFARMRQSEHILSAIAVIVVQHTGVYFTAIAIVLSALASFAIRDITLRRAATCIRCGLALWLTSVFLLV